MASSSRWRTAQTNVSDSNLIRGRQLIENLQSNDQVASSEAGTELQRMLPSNPKLLPLILPLFEDARGHVREYALRAISNRKTVKLGREPVLPLAKRLVDEKNLNRLWAAEILRRYMPFSMQEKSIVEQNLRTLKDQTLKQQEPWTDETAAQAVAVMVFADYFDDQETLLQMAEHVIEKPDMTTEVWSLYGCYAGFVSHSKALAAIFKADASFHLKRIDNVIPDLLTYLSTFSTKARTVYCRESDSSWAYDNVAIELIEQTLDKVSKEKTDLMLQAVDKANVEKVNRIMLDLALARWLQKQNRAKEALTKYEKILLNESAAYQGFYHIKMALSADHEMGMYESGYVAPFAVQEMVRLYANHPLSIKDMLEKLESKLENTKEKQVRKILHFSIGLIQEVLKNAQAAKKHFEATISELRSEMNSGLNLDMNCDVCNISKKHLADLARQTAKE